MYILNTTAFIIEASYLTKFVIARISGSFLYGFAYKKGTQTDYRQNSPRHHFLILERNKAAALQEHQERRPEFHPSLSFRYEFQTQLLTSCESKGLIPDFMSMLASTKYFRQVVRRGLPDSS